MPRVVNEGCPDSWYPIREMPATPTTICAVRSQLPGVCAILASLFASCVSVGLALAAPSQAAPPLGAPLVVRQERWTILSPAANHYTAACAGDDGADTWLGTPVGIKHVTPRINRIYTPLDGLPAGTVRAITRHPGEVWCIVVPETAPEPGVTLCRWNHATDRWLPLPRFPMKGVLPPRLLLAASGKDVYLAAAGTGVNPVGSVYRFADRTHRWQPLSLPTNARGTITFLQAAPDEGIFLGTVGGLFQWHPDRGWTPLLAGYRISTGVREADGSWWLIATEGKAIAASWELLHVSPDRTIVGHYAFPIHPGEGPLPDFSLVETTEAANRARPTLWAVGLEMARGPVRSDFGWEQPCPWIVRFSPPTTKAEIVPLETPENLTRVPLPVLLPLLPLGANLPPAWAQRFSAYDSPPSDTPVPPSSYIPPPIRGEAGTDADGATWDREQNAALVRTTPSGSKETFPLPPILLPVRGDLAGVAVTAQGAVLALTRDSLLRHEPGTPTDAWQPLTVPYTNPSTTWYRYASESRLLPDGDTAAWLATDAFALHFPLAGKPEMAPALVTNGGSVQTLLGVRKDGSAWITGGEAIQLIGPGGVAPMRTFTPAVSPPGFTTQQSSPMHHIGGMMGDVVWYEGQVSQPDVTAHSALVGYVSPKERWTTPLPCYRVLALRAGIDGESGSSETVWALIEEDDPKHTLRLVRWQPESDTWQQVGAPLPDGARLNDLALRLVYARPNAVWVVDRDRLILYHWDDSRQRWNVHAAPPGSGIFAGNSVAEAGVYAEHALDGSGPAVYVAGLTGLWEFKVGPRTWRAVALPSFGQWWLLRVADGGPDAAWAVLFHPASGTYAGARFDKKSKAWAVFGSAEGFPTTDGGDYTLAPDAVHPGQACWLLIWRHLYRYDPAGHWRDRTAEVTGGDTRVMPRKIVAAPTGDAWVVLGTIPPMAAPATAAKKLASESSVPLVAHWLRASDSFTRHRPEAAGRQALSGTDVLPEANGNVLLGTTGGVFHRVAGRKAWSRLEIPAFPEMPVYDIVRTSQGLWLLGQDCYAWLRL